MSKNDLGIHAYAHIEMDKVWNVVQISIPDVINKVEIIFQEKGRGV